MKRRIASAALALCLSTPALAAGWSVDPGPSKIVFGSVKAGNAGESHSFPGVTGHVGEDGTATVEIDVTTVDTGIEIRDERMQEQVFRPERFPKATVRAKIDLDKLSDLDPGATTTLTTEATLGFLGREVPLTADLFVAPLGEDRVLVTSDALLMLATEELGIDKGIDALQEIAGLPSITRVTPVAVRLVFSRD